MSNISVYGLSHKEALTLLKRDGFNELPEQKKPNILTTIFRVATEPMLLLLLAAGGIYLFLGDTKDSILLVGGAMLIVFITLYQERKTENALEELKKLSNPKTFVYRDGKRVQVYSRELVAEDIFELREGDRVPADALILEQTNLLVDESVLTGESVGVRKVAGNEKLSVMKPGGEDLPFVFSGTMVTRGKGLAKVVETGPRSEMGKIGRSLLSITEEDTLLKREMTRIIKIFALVGLTLCLVLALILWVRDQDLIESLLAGLTLGMALIPEEFSVVLLIFLTLGSLRISKRKVLTRHGAAIETLGAINTLCVDKTGTITINQMELASMMAENEIFSVRKEKVSYPEKYHELLEFAILASSKDGFDPMEKEIHNKASHIFGKDDHVHENWELVKEYPIAGQVIAITNVWQAKKAEYKVVATKGAPETIIKLCKLKGEFKKSAELQIKLMANEGMRILGVARSVLRDDRLPDNQSTFDFEFLGFLGFIDPIREDVLDSVNECYGAGIRVVLITGDYPGTAVFTAKQIGLSSPEVFVTGDEISQMNHLELREKIKGVNVFARVVPEQKLLIVNALKANGEVVAMTGDGVNDAPALKAAHVGISMGKRGTDVAREASDMILLNDDFGSIVHAIRLGRRIFDNLRKSMSFIFSVHFPIAGIALIPTFLGLPVVFFPAHIAFMELIIDPTCSTVFESVPEESDIMNRPPRNLKQSLLDRVTLTRSAIQGILLLIVVFLIYVLSIQIGVSVESARSTTFMTLILGDLSLILVNLSKQGSFLRSMKRINKPFVIITSLTLILLVASFNIPFLKDAFHFVSPTLGQTFVALGVSVVMLLVQDQVKRWKI